MSADEITPLRRELTSLATELRAVKLALYRLVAGLLGVLLTIGQLAPISRFALTERGPVENWSLFWLAPGAITGGGSTSAVDWVGYAGFIGLTVITLLAVIGLFILAARRAIGEDTRLRWIRVVTVLLVIGTGIGALQLLSGGTAIWPTVVIEVVAVVLTVVAVFAAPQQTF